MPWSAQAPSNTGLRARVKAAPPWATSGTRGAPRTGRTEKAPEITMAHLELTFESGDESLSVRSFRVEEGLNALFTVAITARSLNPDLDLASFVSQDAAFCLAAVPPTESLKCSPRRRRCFLAVGRGRNQHGVDEPGPWLHIRRL